MTELATTDPTSVTAPPKPAKRERIPPRLAEAIRLLETGECKTQVAAAQRVGMNATYLCEALKKPKIQAFIARKRAENISLGALSASYQLPALVHAESEHIRFKASERLLEQSGDLRVANGGHSVNVNVSTHLSAGYVIDLTPWKPIAAPQQIEGNSPASLTHASVINDIEPIKRS